MLPAVGRCQSHPADALTPHLMHECLSWCCLCMTNIAFLKLTDLCRCFLTLDNVAFHCSMSPCHCVYTSIDVHESMNTFHDWYVHALVVSLSCWPMSLGLCAQTTSNVSWLMHSTNSWNYPVNVHTTKLMRAGLGWCWFHWSASLARCTNVMSDACKVIYFLLLDDFSCLKNTSLHCWCLLLWMSMSTRRFTHSMGYECISLDTASCRPIFLSRCAEIMSYVLRSGLMQPVIGRRHLANACRARPMSSVDMHKPRLMNICLIWYYFTLNDVAMLMHIGHDWCHRVDTHTPRLIRPGCCCISLADIAYSMLTGHNGCRLTDVLRPWLNSPDRCAQPTTDK